MSVQEIEWARKALALGPSAKLSEVRKAYRMLAKKHHPDRRGSHEAMQEINQAYTVLMAYISSYEYPFTEEEVRSQNPALAWEEAIANDPVWGKPKK